MIRISDFSPVTYLEEYYTKLDNENALILEFLAEVYQEIGRTKNLLELGGGPTIYQLISAAPKIENIVFTDYLEENLQVIRDWRANSKNIFDWTPYFERVLTAEGIKPTADKIQNRKSELRRKIRSIPQVDITNPHLLADTQYENTSFNIISSWFVLEAAVNSYSRFQKVINNLRSNLTVNGYLIMGFITGASTYKIGDQDHEVLNINPDFIQKSFKSAGFSPQNTKLITASAQREYSHIYCTCARLEKIRG